VAVAWGQSEKPQSGTSVINSQYHMTGERQKTQCVMSELQTVKIGSDTRTNCNHE
jgi:hypothetical protein